jgi:hypothetical protein
MKVGAKSDKPPLPRLRLECWHGEKKLETQYIGLKSGKKIKTLTGPGVSNKVICDLNRYGKAEAEMDSGRVFKYEIEK